MNVNDSSRRELDGERKSVAETGAAEQKAGQERMHWLRSVALGAVYAFFGYWMGLATLPFGAVPFGIAMLCAADRGVLYSYA